jgi:hypothetical protein
MSLAYLLFPVPHPLTQHDTADRYNRSLEFSKLTQQPPRFPSLEAISLRPKGLPPLNLPLHHEVCLLLPLCDDR